MQVVEALLCLLCHRCNMTNCNTNKVLGAFVIILSNMELAVCREGETSVVHLEAIAIALVLATLSVSNLSFAR